MTEMTRVSALVSAAGIDPRESAAAVGALMVRGLPMRINGGPPCSPEATVKRGWCSGLEAFAELMEVVTGAPRQSGTAFAADWPWFEVGGQVVAPGLPVRLSQGIEEPGPDGAYTLDGGRVLRESAGRRREILDTKAKCLENTTDLDLIWFSEGARFLVRGSRLEIEDLFSKTICGIDHNRLDQLLVRTRRVEPDVIEGMTIESDSGPTVVEVARILESQKVPWRDPVAYLQSRIDVENVEGCGDRIVIKDLLGDRIEVRTTHNQSGWVIERATGRFPYESLSIQRDEDDLVLQAKLGPEAEIFSPGRRGRLVFDLNADLTAFIHEHQKV